jgi:hypothetical protein
MLRVTTRLAYLVRNMKIFKRSPYPLHEWTKTPCEEGNILVLGVLLDGLESWSSARAVVDFARIGHGCCRGVG